MRVKQKKLNKIAHSISIIKTPRAIISKTSIIWWAAFSLSWFKLKNKIEAAVDMGTDDCVVDSNAFLKETIDGIWFK